MQTDVQQMLKDRLRPEDLWPFLRKGWWLVVGVAVLCTLGAAGFSSLMPREYKATSVIRIVPSQGQEVASRDVLDLDVRGFQEVERFYRTQMQLFKSRAFAERVAERYAAQTGEEITANRVLGSLEVFPIERSQLVQISFIDGDPEVAAELADLSAMAFVEMNIEWRRDLAANANDWVEKRIGEMRTRRQEKVDEILRFKAENNIVEQKDESGGALASRMTALEDNYGTMSTRRVLLESRVDGHNTLYQRGQYLVLGAQEDFPMPPGLRELHARTLAEHTSISARYGEQHPEFKRSQASLERVEERFRREVRRSLDAERAELELLRSQEERLRTERLATKDEVLSQQTIDATYRQLQQELRQIEGAQSKLLQRRDELELTSETESNNAHLVDHAVPPETFVRPRILLSTAGGLVVGLLLGLGAALLRGLLDDTMNSPADVETFTGQSVMGVIPKISIEPGEGAELLAHQQPRSAVSEAIRGVAAMAENRPSGQRCKLLLVTSSVASEGKTTMSVGLATVLAQRGRRVVLVEGDHRRPRVHKLFGTRKDLGVVEVLLGRATLEEAIVPTEIPNLWVLPRGSAVAGGVELIGTEEMEAVLNELAERFDRVVIDTPPSAALSDSLTLSRWVDGVVVVARAGVVSRSLVRHTLRRLEQVGAPVFGVVLNDFQMERSGRYHAYYAEQYYYYASDEDEVDDDGEGEAAK